MMRLDESLRDCGGLVNVIFSERVESEVDLEHMIPIHSNLAPIFTNTPLQFVVLVQVKIWPMCCSNLLQNQQS